MSLGSIGESGSSRNLSKIGGGTLTIDSPSSYTGTTTVAAGTLQTTPTGTISTGPLVVNSAAGISSTLNLNNDQTVASLTGTVSGGGTARVNVAGGTTFTVAQSGSTIFAGTIALSGPSAVLAKSGSGTLELDGAPTLSGGSALNVSGGKLRFNVTSGSATIGAGVTATVSSGATLELAGSVSALASGSNRVNIVNNSTSAGVLVSGTLQHVGNIDGNGTTQVNAGSDLTANHIVQSALVIAGTSTSHALVTIAASDASGNSLAASNGLPLTGSQPPNEPFGANAASSAAFAANGSAALAPLTSADLVDGATPTSVPEPSTLMLLLLALSAVAGQRMSRR